MNLCRGRSPQRFILPPGTGAVCLFATSRRDDSDGVLMRSWCLVALVALGAAKKGEKKDCTVTSVWPDGTEIQRCAAAASLHSLLRSKRLLPAASDPNTRLPACLPRECFVEGEGGSKRRGARPHAIASTRCLTHAHHHLRHLDHHLRHHRCRHPSPAIAHGHTPTPHTHAPQARWPRA